MSVCLFVSEQYYGKTTGPIPMKLRGRLETGPRITHLIWGRNRCVVAPIGGTTAVFMTLNGPNSVAITLITAKLGMNIVAGSALSLVTQRKKITVHP